MVALFRQLGLAVMCSLIMMSHNAYAQTMSAQTDVDRARHIVDDEGVPKLDVSGIGVVAHPAWVALYALAYAGVEDYEPDLGLTADPQKFSAAIDWLKRNLVPNAQGQWVWRYDFDSTYNDVAITAPWSSAFAQATGVQALLSHWRQTGDQTSLDLAKKAAASLFVPLADGGFLFQSGEDIWFEEIPAPVENPSHILNGNLRALLAIAELGDATGDQLYADWLKKGEDTLLRWLPLFDAGYWLRYDLNPRKTELLFRLANPYGFDNPNLAIDRITLRDPVSGRQSELDLGTSGDDEGPMRMAGNDWGQTEDLAGHTIRRLMPVPGQSETLGSEGEMVAPYAYFYVALPADWTDNLRADAYELSIDYFDETPGNLSVQMRSIAPGSATFRNLDNGDLLLSGAGRWRQWTIDLSPSDLGYWVGDLYARKHADYLESLSQRDARLKPWATMAKGYEQAVLLGKDYVTVSPEASVLPRQTPVLPTFSLDSQGVLMQHISSAEAGTDTASVTAEAAKSGKPVYSPFIIASQLLDENNSAFSSFLTEGSNHVRREPALSWFLDQKNQAAAGAGIAYRYGFDNAYNDVATAAPWQSAFGQAYVLQALDAAKGMADASFGLDDLTARVAEAYAAPLSEGGLSSVDKQGGLFFEEVPNATHVLNAHLVSTVTLADLGSERPDGQMTELAKKGLKTLRAELALFDTGYWLRYDLNPRKELLFQLDWLEGDTSPLIETITLEAPQFAQKVTLDVGGDGAFDGASRISGVDWTDVAIADGRSGRSFVNGRRLHAEAVDGGTRENVYALLQLPNARFDNYSDVLPHRLRVRYKDVAPGRFNIKIQSINEGSRLEFIPLRNAVLTTTGDQQWKEAVFEIRPQDMGWFKGVDYQRYEVDQLDKLATITGDWFFRQQADQQRYYLDAYEAGTSPIVVPADDLQNSVDLSLTQASPTYEGFGFENALDGDPNDDYVAGIENSASYVVDLKLARPITSGSVALSWEGTSNYAGRVRIYAGDGPGELLADTPIESGAKTLIDFTSAQPIQSLRAEFSDFAGQSRLLLRQFEVLASNTETAASPIPSIPVAPIPSPPEAPDPDEAFLSPNDPRNPIGLMRQSVSWRIKQISDDMFQPELGSHANILKFMDFIDEFETGIARSPSPDDTILDRKGACGSFTNTLLALAAAQGLEGRIISLLNYPKNDGHVVAEIKLESGWVLYDPTYNAYYTRQGSDEPLSFEDVKAAYQGGETLTIHRRSQRPGGDVYTGPDIFQHASPMGVIGPDKPFYFPLTLDINQRSAVEATDFGPRWQGTSYLGAAYINQQQDWTIAGLQPGKHYGFDISPDWLGGDLSDNSRNFELRAVVETGDGSALEVHHEFDFTDNAPGVWTIPFTAHAKTAKILIRHDERGPKYKYIQIKRYNIIEY